MDDSAYVFKKIFNSVIFLRFCLRRSISGLTGREFKVVYDDRDFTLRDLFSGRLRRCVTPGDDLTDFDLELFLVVRH